MIEEIFDVQTEFTFGVGQAIMQSKALEGAVESLSESVAKAQSKFQMFGVAIAQQMGLLGTGGFLGFLYKAIAASEDWHMQALQMSGMIGSNMSALGGTINTFNQRLATSEMVMGRIGQEAQALGLDGKMLFGMTHMLAQPLLNRGKAGTNFTNASRMAGNTMLAAESLGINPMFAAQSVTNALTTGMGLHGKMFGRLVNTSAFRGAGIKTQQQLAGMPLDKRIELMDKALNVFRQDTEFMTFRLESLHVQMQIMKNAISNFLKPIGDAITKPLAQLVRNLRTWFEQNSGPLADAIGMMLGKIISNPKNSFVNFEQAKAFGGDFKQSFKIFEGYRIAQFVLFLVAAATNMTKLGVLGKIVTAAWDGLSSAFSFLISKITFGGAILRFISFAFWEFIAPLLAILAVMQLISRAKAIAKVNDVTEVAKQTPRLAAASARFAVVANELFGPFIRLFDWMANKISIIFEWSLYMRLGIWLINLMSDAMQGAIYHIWQWIAVFDAIGAAVTKFISNIMSGKWSTSGSGVLDSAMQAYGDTIEKNKYRWGDTSKAVAARLEVTNNNIAKVEMNMEFKEQNAPDRIAFSVKEQLFNAVKNPTRGRGTGLSTPLATPAGGN